MPAATVGRSYSHATEQKEKEFEACENSGNWNDHCAPRPEKAESTDKEGSKIKV
jgi:hypothetical protein